MLEQKDLRKISLYLLQARITSTMNAINLIYDVIDKECNGAETSASDVYEEIIETILYIGEKENEKDL